MSYLFLGEASMVPVSAEEMEHKMGFLVPDLVMWIRINVFIYLLTLVCSVTVFTEVLLPLKRCLRRPASLAAMLS